MAESYWKERRRGVNCVCPGCCWREEGFEQQCSKENTIGIPGPESCIEYVPEQILEEK